MLVLELQYVVHSCYVVLLLPQSYYGVDLNTYITSLPNSIGRLEKLEHLNLSRCRSLLDLPQSLGNLQSLDRLDISETNITRLPCSIGRLEKLERLNLRYSKITLLPESFGDLKSLVYLDISGSRIAALPSTINRISLLQTFKLDFCPQLHELSELPSSLTQLKIDSECLKKVSDLSNLQDVTSLELIGGSSILEWNASFPSKLQSLTIQLLCISRLPDLNSCSQLSYLKLSCERSLKVLPNMSGLRKLLTLEIESCMELAQIPGIGKLHCLTSLLIKKCPALECLENLRELKELKEFNLVGCQKLTEIRGLGQLQALTKVRVQDCESLEKFDDLTALKELKEFTLVGCRELTGSSDDEVPGYGELQLLDLMPNEMPHSLNQMENVYGEAEVDRRCQHGELQLLDLLPDEMAHSLNHHMENVSGEAEGDRHRQLMGSEQSEAEDYPHRKRRRYHSISTEQGKLSMRLSSGDMDDVLSMIDYKGFHSYFFRKVTGKATRCTQRVENQEQH